MNRSERILKGRGAVAQKMIHSMTRGRMYEASSTSAIDAGIIKAANKLLAPIAELVVDKETEPDYGETSHFLIRPKDFKNKNIQIETEGLIVSNSFMRTMEKLSKKAYQKFPGLKFERLDDNEGFYLVGDIPDST